MASVKGRNFSNYECYAEKCTEHCGSGASQMNKKLLCHTGIQKRLSRSFIRKQ